MGREISVPGQVDQSNIEKIPVISGVQMDLNKGEGDHGGSQQARKISRDPTSMWSLSGPDFPGYFALPI